jgi:DNA adenine methylase
MTKMQKPFLKWVGGKSQILGIITSKFPREMNNYHEIFLGGGSVLLGLLSLQQTEAIVVKDKIYAYDANESLINLFKCVQQNKDELFEIITKFRDEYHSLKGDIINRKPQNLLEAKSSKESYYYWIRNRFNSIDKHTIESSALFMFLNKTGFRGLFREGPNGFNVPYGHYKITPTIISKDVLDDVSKLISNVEFICCDFTKSLERVKSGDYVYLDPPYAPINSKSFVGYTKSGFDMKSHKMLFDILNANKINFSMSNAKVQVVTDAFKDFRSVDIIAKRSINSKNPGSTSTEILIFN